jgi:hypothetical protein
MPGLIGEVLLAGKGETDLGLVVLDSFAADVDGHPCPSARHS